MKRLLFQDLTKLFSPNIFHRGNDYYQTDAVVSTQRKIQTDPLTGAKEEFLSAKVMGNVLYHVSFPLEEGSITRESIDAAECTCPYFREGYGECKHIVAAAIFAVIHDSKIFKENLTESNFLGRNLLDSYKKSPATSVKSGEIQLKPRICDIDQDYPYIQCSVGKDRLYVVKKLDEFMDAIHHEETVFYGKSLQFTHSLCNFDQKSQNFIQIIDGQNNQTDSFYGHRSTGHFTPNKRSIRMDHNSFKLFFQLFLGDTVEVDGWTEKEVTLEDGDPSLTIQILKREKGADIRIHASSPISFFGNEFSLFALTDHRFYRCSWQYSSKMYRLCQFFGEEIFVSEADLPTFCVSVLSQVKDYVTVVDDDQVSQDYLPDECVPCFYFDIDPKSGVTAVLKYQYGDIEVTQRPSAKQKELYRQNQVVEAQALSQLETYFEPIVVGRKKVYHLSIEEEVFLTSVLREFREFGAVYLSQSLSGRFVDSKSKPTLGISVSDGILSLDMDTGEFPAQELQDLYQSFLRKKKYHKLKDGRILFLDGSGFEKVAEISHMLQLSSRELEQTRINLPAYRGLYLDHVLETEENVNSTRNQGFRRMMKDFKSVADSDFQPSSSLQTTLRPYQVVGFQWMKTLEHYGFGGILADEMGLGKTVQVITYLLSLQEEGEDSLAKTLPSLVVCPASLLFNWSEELQRFAPSLRVLPLFGNAKERKAMLEEEGDHTQVWVTSYDLLRRDKDLLLEKQFYACILDEGQNIKNSTTISSKTVKNLLCHQRFVLTGTPIENRLSELWNLFDFLMPEYLFSHHTFVNKLEKPIVQSGEVSAKRQLSLLVQPFLMRRLKKDVLKELPDKLEYVRKIALSEEERKVYFATMNQVREKAAQTENKLQILALLTHLRQLCCDPQLCFENYEGSSSKLEACMELCQTMVSNGHKILLFSQFTSMLDLIRQRLNEEGISNLTIEGSTPKEKRGQYVKEFQNGMADVFLISLKAGGTGLNLTNADVVIHYDPWWNQAAQNQATDRAHRMGQKEHVQVYKLIAQGTIEEKILTLQEKKASLMDAITEDTTDEPLSRDDILDLLES